jgi:hypothetical protein
MVTSSCRSTSTYYCRSERETLADALKSLKQGVSRRLIINAEHFWQKRYYDFNIRNEQQFGNRPVIAMLCSFTRSVLA